MVSCHGDTTGVVGVGSGPPNAALRIRGVGPNPSHGAVCVTFAAARGVPVLLRLMDVAGRVVDSATLQGPGPGDQSVTLGVRAALAPGVYLVRMAQGALADVRVVTIVR